MYVVCYWIVADSFTFMKKWQIRSSSHVLSLCRESPHYNIKENHTTYWNTRKFTNRHTCLPANTKLTLAQVCHKHKLKGTKRRTKATSTANIRQDFYEVCNSSSNIIITVTVAALCQKTLLLLASGSFFSNENPLCSYGKQCLHWDEKMKLM